jgi:hypothetical protein
MKILFNYFWLLAILVNGINASILWVRSQPSIRKNPNLRSGYIAIIRSLALGLTVPWVVMGIGLTGGGVSKLADYFYPRAGNIFVLAWWVSLWGVILLYSSWILFRGGAKMLIDYPGLFRGSPSSPQTIKLMCLLSLLSSVVVSVMMFSIHKK